MTKTRTETELPSQVVTSKSLKPSEGAKSANGFRHFTPVLREESRLVFHADPHGLTAEQFRFLRRTLSQDCATGAVLMITSPGMGDGKTFTSLNLCTCLADSGDPTLLVEADVRRPTVSRILGCAMEPPGFEDALAGKVEPGKATQLIEELSFHAALVAKVPNDPSQLVSGTAAKRFLAWAREHFRWVVLDAPPVLPAADVAELLPLTDGVLLVIRADNTPRELSKRAIDLIGTYLYGVIFNEVTNNSSPYYRYLKKYYRGAGTS